MRLFPDIWPGPDRLNWLCVGLELLGLDCLTAAPDLLSGMRSITRAAPARDHARIIQNLRHLSLGFATRKAIRHAVERYLEFNRERDPAFLVDPTTLHFEQPERLLEPEEIEQARNALQSVLPLAPSGDRRADPNREMAVRLGRDALPQTIPALGFEPPPVTNHDLDRRPRGDIEVSWAELLTEARAMDREDSEQPNLRPGNWAEILRRARLSGAVGENGLQHLDRLWLTGVQHLIGLPGSGKTTLLLVLTRWLARNGFRVALFFPSIEVCRQKLAILARYGVKAGLLVGQSPVTRRSHMDRIAEAIGAGPERGFGHTLPGADRFAANCVLAGFSREGTAAWPFGKAPCNDILQRASRSSRARSLRCPLWSVCGRNRAPRELPETSVWLGHVLSMDTSVPRATCSQRLTYYELIARTFDLVVFDEADRVQHDLDSYGATRLELSGTQDSMHRVVQEQVHTRFARGDNSRLSDSEINVYTRELAEFGNQTNNLVHLLHNLDSSVQRRYQRLLLTPARILDTLVRQGRSNIGPTRLRAIINAWDQASWAAVSDSSQESDELDENRAVENELGRWREQLTQLFRAHLAAVYTRRRDAITERIIELVAVRALQRQADRREQVEIRLLLHVTFVIRWYQRIVPGMRTMVAEGLLSEQTVTGAISDALRRYCPESLLGHLSGVRFDYDHSLAVSTRPNARNVRLSYVSFVAAPRLLMTRMHDLLADDGLQRGPAVLLTSATSFLEDSPAFHINVGLPWVLRAREPEDEPVPPSPKSRFSFQWFPDPRLAGQPLRFSGAGVRQEANLLAMIEHLVRGGIGKSELFRIIRRFDEQDGIHRKAGLIVNSYDQAKAIKTYLDRAYPEIGRRTVAVVRALPDARRDTGYVTTTQVPALGDEPDWDILVFPLGALGRGTNIVFSSGPRARHATLGSLWFLTRPHPPAGDLSLLVSLAGREAEHFDRSEFDEQTTLTGIGEQYRSARRQLYRMSERLLRDPLMASRLGELFRPFTANLMVDILQAIGRGMRGGRPVQVFFVDAAWAPNSAGDEAERPGQSMLVEMLEILTDCVTHSEPTHRAIYRELYLPFFRPFRNIRGVLFPEALRTRLDMLEL